MWWERGTGGFDMTDLRIIVWRLYLYPTLDVGTGKFM